MKGLYAIWQKPVLKSIGVLIVALLVLSACGSSGSSSTSTPSATGTSAQACTGQTQPPIKIGISLSLTGDFSADGMAFQQGYQLWADNVNKSGGVLWSPGHTGHCQRRQQHDAGRHQLSETDHGGSCMTWYLGHSPLC